MLIIIMTNKCLSGMPKEIITHSAALSKYYHIINSLHSVNNGVKTQWHLKLIL